MIIISAVVAVIVVLVVVDFTVYFVLFIPVSEITHKYTRPNKYDVLVKAKNRVGFDVANAIVFVQPILRGRNIYTHTHTHTHIRTRVCVYVYVCACVYISAHVSITPLLQIIVFSANLYFSHKSTPLLWAADCCG